MSDCALVEGLRDRLGLGDIGSAVGAVGGEFSIVGVALPSLDMDGLSAITGSLGIDAGPLTSAGGDLASRLGDVAGGIDPTGLVAPLLQLVGQAEQLSGADPLALLARISERVGSGAGDDGIAKLQRVLGPIAEGGSDSALQGLVSLGSALLPALPESPLAPLGVWGGGITAFVTLAGGLMAVESRSRVIERGPALAWQRLAPLRAGRLEALAAWGASGLPVRLAANPDDPAVATDLTRYLVDLSLIVKELEDAVGTAELALAVDDPQRAALQLVAVEPLLGGTAPDPLLALCNDLAGRLSPLIQSAGVAGGPGLDEQVDAVLALVGRLEAAVAGIDAAALSAPVRNAVGQVTSGLTTIADGIGAGVGAVTMALHALRDAVLAVDLRPLTDAVRQVVQPLADALEQLDALLSSAMSAIADAMEIAAEAIATARDAILLAAGAVKDAFDRLAAAVDSLDLVGKIAALQGGINDVAAELQRIRLEPYFDTSADIMSTAADALRLVPVDMLPDDLKQKLVEVSAQVKAIDFPNDVRAPLTTQLDALIAEFDTDVLGQVAVFHQQLVDFLNSLDPAAALVELEARFDQDLVAPLLALDPDQLLAPVTAAIAQAQQRIAAVDLRGMVLRPVEEAFASILAAIDQANPATALQPLADRLTAARTQVEAAIGLDQWAGSLDQLHAELQKLLDRIDLALLLPRMESSYQLLLSGLRDIPGGGAVGALVATLLGKALPVSPESWQQVTRWLAEGGAAAAVRARMAAAQTSLQAAAALLRATDIAAAAARIGAMHTRLRNAVLALPVGHALRLRHAAALERSPAERLSALLAGQGRLLATADAGAAALMPLVASGFSHTDLARTRLNEGLAPLAALKQQVLGLARRFGIEPTGRDLGAVFSQILAALRPSRVLAALQPIVTALKSKLVELVQVGLVQPLKDGIQALRDLIALIDLAPVVAELAAIHAAVRGQIAALQPSVLLGDVLDSFDALRDNLASYDPLAPARIAVDAFKAAVTDLAAPGSPVRPTILFAGIVSVHREVTDAVATIDVRNLLRPVLDALSALVQQLDQGLASTEDAFADLQEALPA